VNLSAPVVRYSHSLTLPRACSPHSFRQATATRKKRRDTPRVKNVLVGTVPIAKPAPCRPPLCSLRLTFGARTVLVPERTLGTFSLQKAPLQDSSLSVCHCAGTLSLRATFACKCWDVPSHIDPHFLKRHFTTTGGLLQAVSGLWFGSTDAKKAVRQRTVSIGTVRCKSGDALRRKLWNDTA